MMNFQQQNDQLENMPKDQETSKLLQELSTTKQQTPEQTKQKKKIPENMCNEGRALLQKKSYLQASKSFSKAVMAFQYLLKNQSLSREQIIQMMKNSILPSYSNLALCHLKLGNYESVLVFSNQILVQDNSNAKALYRRAMAYKGLKQFEQAICDFTSLKKLSISDQSLADQMIRQCKICIQQQKQKQKKFASSLLKNYSYDDSTKSELKSKQHEKNGIFSNISQFIRKKCNKLAFWRRNN